MNSKLIFIAVFFAAITSCNRHPNITQDEALSAIREFNQYPKAKPIPFHLTANVYNTDISKYQDLIDSGYILKPETIYVHTTPLVPEGIPHLQIELTQKGQNLVRGTDLYSGEDVAMVKAAEEDVLNIVQLDKQEDGTYSAQYTVGYARINPFGRFYEPSAREGYFDETRLEHAALVWNGSSWGMKR